jgi:hypothetical protein
MFGQLVVLKMHEKALKEMQVLKRAKEIMAREAVVEEQPQPTYVPCPKINDSYSTILDKSEFDFSVEEPLIDDKRNLTLQINDKEIKIAGAGSITLSNNMV